MESGAQDGGGDRTCAYGGASVDGACRESLQNCNALWPVLPGEYAGGAALLATHGYLRGRGRGAAAGCHRIAGVSATHSCAAAVAGCRRESGE